MPFNLSFTHLMVVAIVALVVLGPERLPGVARTAGNLYREWRRISSGLEAEVREVFSEFTEPFAGPFAENVAGPLSEIRTSFTDSVQGVINSSTGARDGTVGDVMTPLAPSLGPALGASSGLVSPGPAIQFHLPELAPTPRPDTFVPYTPGAVDPGRAGGDGA